MKQLRNYISIRKGKSVISATDDTIHQIVKDELDHFGHGADLNHIDVSEVTKMNNVFSVHKYDLGEKYKDLNPDISRWDVSNVKSMYCMFYDCKKFNCDISQWDVSNVENMGNTFYNCTNFNCDISKWNVSNVTYMQFMFSGCKKFNKDLSRWDVSNIKNSFRIFLDCPIKEEFKPKFKK